jgi:Transposase
MSKAKNSGIYPLKRFAKTLRRDWNAVKNSLEKSFSNGPVEGHIVRPAKAGVFQWETDPPGKKSEAP